MNTPLAFTRECHLQRLDELESVDLVIVGAGATGCGIALDASSRGLSVVLIERFDFAEGTSSRSSKLIHGGVRYLKDALLHLDRNQWRLVKEGLKERSTLLRIAPRLCSPLGLLVPAYSRLRLPFLYLGLRLYDFLAGQTSLPPSRLLSPEEALKSFPTLRSQGLKGAILYHDVQFDDARMALGLLRRASELGAVILNQAEVTHLKKNHGVVTGVRIRDRINGTTRELAAHVVVNACGPFSDHLRQLDRPGTSPLLKSSSGAHLTLKPDGPMPKQGMLIPETEDGRVLFVLPWHDHLLVGTTDTPRDPEAHPPASPEDVRYLLNHLNRYLDKTVSPKDVLSSWCGFRPLLAPPAESSDTAGIVRDFCIEVSETGLVTVTGGKWTSYRAMAEKAVSRIERRFNLKPKHASRTKELAIGPAAEKRPSESPPGTTEKTWRHLCGRYGKEAAEILPLIEQGYEKMLSEGYPYIEAEVLYAVRYEMCCRPLDFLARRTPMALLNLEAAKRALPRVVELMGDELGWDEQQRRDELKDAQEKLENGL